MKVASGSCVARYYDPRTSVWQSADPILGQYLPSSSQPSAQLAGGGVYKSLNLAMYSYSFQSPVVYIDPDGNRALRPGEVTMAWKVFGNSIDYSKVDVYQKPIFKGTSTVLGFANAILFAELKSDFSKADPGDKEHFIHEMAHIMQSQNGMFTTVRGIFMQVGAYIKGFIKGLFTLSNPFATAESEVKKLYDLSKVDSNSTVNDLNMEQQAEIFANDFAGGERDKKGKVRSSIQDKATKIRNNSPDLPNEWGPEKNSND